MLNNILLICNIFITLLFFACFSYWAVFVASKFRKWRRPKDAREEKKYGILISARNEENVIGNLIDSVFAQNYDPEKLKVFLVADNCTDHTAEVARAHKAIVYERFDQVKKGKSFALQYLIEHIKQDYTLDVCDVYLIFDADNILDHNFVHEINKVFCMGYPVAAGYRNSTNFDENWISYSYALWFAHESGLMNRGRMMTGHCCLVSGTGYGICKEILKEHGWNWFLMTEDFQLSAECILKGRQIGYTEDAVFFDEQPTGAKISIKQRRRWDRGYLQVLRHYGARLMKKAIFEKSFSSYDIVMAYIPALLITLASLFMYIIFFIIGILTSTNLSFITGSFIMWLASTYFGLFMIGLYTAFTERRKIICEKGKQIKYLFLFPVFMLMNFPIALVALIKSSEWDPIPHAGSRSAEEILKENSAKKEQ